MNWKVGNTALKKLCVILLILVIISGFIGLPRTLAAGNVPDNINVLLGDYSQFLNSGETLHQPFYAAAVKTLVTERRDYYNEFYTVGLHTNLTTISSKFYPEDAVFTRSGNVYYVEILEMVTMFGYPKLNSADDYPMIPAARWAISKTDNENVKEALEQYIESTRDAVNDSITNGVETYFRVKHKFVIVEAQKGQMYFSKDIFTDKEIDNGDGFDNVNWVNGRTSRSKPDLTQMPDYVIYQTSMETLGQQLLDDYTKAYGGITPEGTGFTYSRSAASNYAKTYSSEATATTCSGIYQNTAYYNPTYQSIWTYTGCNDCADFISQALRAGGFPPDTNWNYTPSPGTYAWRVFDFSSGPQGLAYYLQNNLNAITVYSSNTSLQVGDLMYDNGLHVVMVTAVGPTKFSGHTNDRKNHAYMTVLNHFWHVKTNVP